MNCPNCGDKMEMADSAPAIWDGPGKDPISGHIPQADYYCENCGSEYLWTRNSGLTVMYDAYGDASCQMNKTCNIKRRGEFYNQLGEREGE